MCRCHAPSCVAPRAPARQFDVGQKVHRGQRTTLPHLGGQRSVCIIMQNCVKGTSVCICVVPRTMKMFGTPELKKRDSERYTVRCLSPPLSLSLFLSLSLSLSIPSLTPSPSADYVVSCRAWLPVLSVVICSQS